MSKTENTILLTPPKVRVSGRLTEDFVSTGHVCNVCGGTGWIWGIDRKEDCPICCGCGELIAKVSIEWTPPAVSHRGQARSPGWQEAPDGAAFIT